MILEFIEETHTYLANGMIVPSVTQIMKPMSEEYYNNLPLSVLEIAADRGTRVHKAIEEYEKFSAIQMNEFDSDIVDYVKNYQIAKVLKKFRPINQEFRLTDGFFAGTIDMLAMYDKQQVIIDLKATSKFNKELAEVQLAGYTELCEKNGIAVNGTYILHITKKGFKLHKVQVNWGKWLELKNAYYENA